MSWPWMAALSVTTMLTAPPLGKAQQPIDGDGRWYYKMGGAAPLSPAPNVNAVAIDLLGSVELQIPRACGSLDPTIAVSNALGDVADGFDNLDNLLVAAATNAIAALPAIILQRANPGLYDHFQNALTAANETYELSVKSCQQIVEDDANGKNFFSGWIRTSQRDSWQTELNDPDADSIEAEEEIDANAGNDGVLWLSGERKGGQGQPELPVIRDTVFAGYNLVLQRDIDDAGSPIGFGARLGELFETPDEASAFAQEVLGDLIVQTCQGCTPRGIAPTGGLLTSLDGEREVLRQRFADLVETNDPPTEAELLEVSSSTVFITNDVIDDLRVLPEEQDRGAFLDRLSSEIALQNTTEKGTSLRRMLLAARHIPEIVNSEQATAFIDNKLAELETLISSLSFESELQERLSARTALLLADIADVTRSASLNVPTDEPDDNVVTQGRVRSE